MGCKREEGNVYKIYVGAELHGKVHLENLETIGRL